ncbi:MAG: PaaI family thioesterase [Micropepsaceae bacterium]
MEDYNFKPLPPARHVPAPSGWTYAEQFDPFEAYLGPYFHQIVDGAHEFSFIVDDRHTNAAGIAHGGALLTFADATLGYALWNATDRAPCVTVSQQSNFLSPANIGDLIACRPEVVRKTREIVFMRADFKADDRIIFSATAVWKIWPKV